MAPTGHDSGKLGEIYDQIMAGDPITIHQLGRECDEVLTALMKVHGDLPGELDKMAGYWKGLASRTFGKLGEKLTGFVGETIAVLDNPNYQQVLGFAGDFLEMSQDSIQDLSDQWNALPANAVPDMPAWDAAAQQILDNLAAVYDTAGGNLKPAKEDPGDVGVPGEEVDEQPDGGESGPTAEDPPPGAPLGAGGDAGVPPPTDGLTFDPTAPPGIGAGGPLTDPPGFDGGLPPGGLVSVRPPDGAGSVDEPAPPLGGPGAPGVGNPASRALQGPDQDGGGASGPGTPAIGSPGAPGADPSTTLTRFDPSGPPPGGPGASPGGSPTTLTSASTASGAAGGPAGGAPAGSALVGRPPFPAPYSPGSLLTSAGARGAGGGVRPRGFGRWAGPGSAAGFSLLSPVAPNQEDEDGERESWLLGDEEWDDAAPADAAIGRPDTRPRSP